MENTETNAKNGLTQNVEAIVEEINSVQRRVKVTVPSIQVDDAFKSTLRDYQSKARINGFRPGKAPLSVVRRMFGASVGADVVDVLIRKSLPNGLEATGVIPVATPVIEEFDTPSAGEAFAYTALVDVTPKISLKNYKGLHVQYHAIDTSDAAVQEVLEDFALERAIARPAEPGETAADGLEVTVSYSVWDGDTQIEHLGESNRKIFLGKDRLPPDLHEGLLGMAVGGHKDIHVAMPPEAGEEVGGKTLRFHVHLDQLHRRDIPAVDDELAKDSGFDTLASLEEEVRTKLEQRAEKERRRQIEDSIARQLRRDNPFEVPPGLVDEHIDRTLEPWGDSVGKHNEAQEDHELRERIRPGARDVVANALILKAIQEAENLDVTEAEIDAFLAEAGVPEDKIGQHPARSDAYNVLSSQKVFDFLIDHAHVQAIENADT